MSTAANVPGRRSLKIAVAVLAVLLVATLSVLVGLFVLGAVTPFSMGGASDSREESEVSPGGVAVDEAYDGAQASGAADTSGGGGDAVADKLVRYASLSLRVDDIPDAVAAIRTAARGAGGFIQSSDLYTDGGGAYPVEGDETAAAATTLTGGYLTIRVRDTDLETFLDQVRALGTVTTENISSQDVTTQYTDLDARIPILEAERDSLTAMLARATTVEEELMIRDRLVSVASELRSLVDQREVLADRDTMATVSIALTVPPSALPPSSVEIPWFSWYELQQAVASGVAGFQRIVYVTLTAVIATAPIWVPLGIVLLVRRRRRLAAAAPDADDVATPEAVESGSRQPSE